MSYVGIDVSVTGTGIAVIDIIAQKPHIHTLETIARPKELKDQPYTWYDVLAFQVGQKFRSTDRVAIEMYAFSRSNSTRQVEAGAIIRDRLHKRGITWYEVAATTLKKFITGHGLAKKDKIMLEVFKRWDVEAGDDNQADALGLAMFRAALDGMYNSLPISHLDAVTVYAAKHGIALTTANDAP